MRKTLLVPLVLVAACVTPYQQNDSIMGGFTDWPTGPGRHHIEVRGNGFTDATTLRMYFNRRALELCRAEGFNAYDGAPRLETSTSVSPASYQSTTTVQGDTATTNTQQTGGYSVTKGNAFGDIACVNR